MKAAILKAHQLTAETYRQRFRSSRRQSEETYMQWMVRTKAIFDKWLKAAEITDYDGLRKAIL